MMMNSLLLDDNMSNLTSASNDQPSISSSTLYPQQSFASSPDQPPPAKKKRNLPGNPDPEAEVVALSPRSLMATNRFMCEICNKGFQRDQNLQLHRRGHNLPWKLKQRPKQELIKKKVYVCPEATCVHHDPSRALGDLTGIKKHFFRKHGEKKWKCEKCSKRYAVQSDWKAHSKVCGTREYRCDCGTLFSRRDSFVTHRAFCDALAEESGARGITTTLSQNNNHHHPLLSHPQPPSSTSHFSLPPHLQQLQVPFPLKIEEQDHHHLPQWLDNHNHHHQQLFPLPNPSHSCMPTTPSLPPLQPTLPSPHMSATALLQKAAQMGVTMSSKQQQQPAGPSSSSSESMLTSRPHQAAAHVMTNLSYASSLAASTAVVNLDLSAREEVGSGNFVTSGCMESAHPPPPPPPPPRTPYSLLQNHHHHHHVMMSNSLPSGSGFQEISSFEEALNGILNHKMGGGSGGGNEGLTRDFLGLRGFPQRGFPNMGSGFDQMNPPSSSLDHHHDQQNQNQTPWQG